MATGAIPAPADGAQGPRTVLKKEGEPMMRYLFAAAAAWSALIGLYTLLLCLADKRAAIQGRFRVPERRFFSLCFAGGAFGLAAGMLAFRHKTLHARFVLAAAGGMLLWGAILFLLAAAAFF